MKNLYELYATEDDLEIGGVWQDLGSARIKLARSGSKNTIYNKTFTKVMKRHKKATFDAVSDKEGRAILAEIFAKSVIKAWEIKNKKGEWESGLEMMVDEKLKVVPFSIANVKKCLLELPDLFRQLQTWADEIKTFQKETEEEQLKN